MARLIQDLAKILKSAHGVPMHVDVHDAEMLVTLELPNNRSQGVKITLRDIPERSVSLVCMRSRASVARDHRSVRLALEANGGFRIGGLALDTSTVPPMIDVVYNLDADELNLAEFLRVLSQIAIYADAIERRNLGSDEF